MTSVVAAGERVRPQRRAADPALAITVASLWLLLGLFVVYPLAMLFARTFVDHGTVDVSGIANLLRDRNQVRAFLNSLLLATLVGVVGTILGFVFAFTAARAV